MQLKIIARHAFVLPARSAEEKPQICAVKRLVLGIAGIAPHARDHARGHGDELRVNLLHDGRHLLDQLVKRRDGEFFDLVFMFFVKFLAVLQAVKLKQVDACCGKACECHNICLFHLCLDPQEAKNVLPALLYFNPSCMVKQGEFRLEDVKKICPRASLYFDKSLLRGV